MEVKALLASTANHFGFLDAYSPLRREFTKSQVAILMYDRVSPKRDNWSTQPLSPENFEEQIEYLSKNYEILPLEPLAQYLQQRKSLPKKAIVIIFDDGYRDNYSYAYPIVKKYHIPATIFLTTGYIGSGKLLIVGDGDDKENLQNLANEIGGKSEFVFSDQVSQSEVPDFIAAADIGAPPISLLSFYKFTRRLRFLNTWQWQNEWWQMRRYLSKIIRRKPPRWGKEGENG